LSRSISPLAQFAFFGVEPKTDETEDAPVGSKVSVGNFVLDFSVKMQLQTASDA
jgi:F0F1-type ATP synthase delta subunit